MQLTPGTKLGPYEVVSLIGSGGMGEVYRARDTRLDRTVAIKVLPTELSANPDFRRRLEREARTISSLNHPHICTLYDIGRQDQTDYLVLEYLEGQTLAERLKRGSLPTEQVLRYGIQIADALEKAHRQGVVHRDLKPGNIMLTESGAKLLDFGLAKAVHPQPSFGLMREGQASHQNLPTASNPLTEEGTLIGTFPYMSPEQLGGRDADARSDIFALGAVLYEMSAGQRAFEGTAPVGVMAAVLEREPQPLTAVQPLAPTALERLVKMCLAKDPDERWQAVHDVKLQLQWLLEGGTRAGVPAPVTVRRRTREHLGWAVAALLAALLLALGYYHRPSPQPNLVRSSLLPPPNASFLPYNFALSPDSTRLAFVAVGADGKDTLWVRALYASIAQQLNGTDGASFPFWSPDSRHIGFFAEGKLKTTDITGARVEILCEAPMGRGGTWNSDGTIVFAPFIAGPLDRVSALGGSATPVSRIPRPGSGQAHRWPSFLPDGRHFLYFIDWSAPADGRGNGIYVGSLDSPDAKLVSSELVGNVLFASGTLLYVRDRTLMAQPFDLDRLETTGPPVSIAEQELQKDTGFSQSGFSVSENGVLVFQSAGDAPSRMVWFDSSGKELGRLSDAGYKDPRLSIDGRFLAVASDDEHNGKYFIRVSDLGRGISARVSEAVIDETPIWSHDGKWITYVSSTGNSFTMYETAADGSGQPRVLIKGGAMMIPNDWSPDGHLLFMDFAKGHPHVDVYSAIDRRVTEFAEGAEAQFSPDGKWIAYTASRGVLVEPFARPGGRIQISSGPGAQPRWSRDGRQIFYISPDRKLVAVSFDPQKGSVGVPRVLFQTRIVAPNFATFQYDVAPDGRFLINSFPSGTSSPVTLITDWTARLKDQ